MVIQPMLKRAPGAARASSGSGGSTKNASAVTAARIRHFVEGTGCGWSTSCASADAEARSGRGRSAL